MYLNNLKNVTGKQCVCCEQFIPCGGTDEYGHEIKFIQNPMDLCPECFKELMDVIKERRKTKLRE